MSEMARLFGAKAGAYASFRPHYPHALFAWLAAHSPGRQYALDIACGNGQASLPLREHFDQVLACDASVEQLRAAVQAPGIHCLAATAEALPLAAGRFDLIVVAQALHWFATPAFFQEAGRLLKPGGLFCAWCYGLMRIDPALDALIDRLYHDTLAAYWPPGRSSIDAGYLDLQPPFARVTVPASAIELQWSIDHLIGYLRTWSAVQRWEQAHGHDPIADLEPTLREAWGDIDIQRNVRWPLHFLAGFPTATPK
ncbi:MAG: class I SAM-dependent methyltransferase [Pseudomonadota bacterium]